MLVQAPTMRVHALGPFHQGWVAEGALITKHLINNTAT